MRKGRPIQTAPTSGQYGPRLLNLPETGTERICLRPAPKEGSPPPLAVHANKENVLKGITGQAFSGYANED